MALVEVMITNVLMVVLVSLAVTAYAFSWTTSKRDVETAAWIVAIYWLIVLNVVWVGIFSGTPVEGQPDYSYWRRGTAWVKFLSCLGVLGAGAKLGHHELGVKGTIAGTAAGVTTALLVILAVIPWLAAGWAWPDPATLPTKTDIDPLFYSQTVGKFGWYMLWTILLVILPFFTIMWKPGGWLGAFVAGLITLVYIVTVFLWQAVNIIDVFAAFFREILMLDFALPEFGGLADLLSGNLDWSNFSVGDIVDWDSVWQRPSWATTEPIRVWEDWVDRWNDLFSGFAR